LLALTFRQRQVAQLLAAGHPRSTVATMLRIQTQTVKKYLQRARRRVRFMSTIQVRTRRVRPWSLLQSENI
jgi:DNA-binding NarL/FixJ family response regulator